MRRMPRKWQPHAPERTWAVWEPHLIWTQPEQEGSQAHSEGQERFLQVQAQKLTYSMATKGHTPGLVTIRILRVPTNLIIRLPKPEKIRSNNSEGGKKIAKNWHTEKSKRVTVDNKDIHIYIYIFKYIYRERQTDKNLKGTAVCDHFP